MTIPLRLTNAASRSISRMFPGYFTEAKHDHYSDFGWPRAVTFDLAYNTWRRNGMAHAGINRTISKTWQSTPALWETEVPRESTLESDIRQRFADLRIWQHLATADARSMIGGWSGVILRVADSKRFIEPVDRVSGGLQGLVEVIPAWAGQLTVSRWHEDETLPEYGMPAMYSFNEASVGDQAQPRSFEVHPDRVVIWSADGTTHARSALEPGFNDLMTMEKISGAGGEGFWKNAKAAPVLETAPDIDIRAMATAMGIQPDEIKDAMNEEVGDWQRGFDKLLMLTGMQAKTLSISLPNPEPFYNVAVQSFAASLLMPQKILTGSQTGERASTEDSAEWAQTCMSRRRDQTIPNVLAVTNRLERFGILPERDWTLGWEDLTEATGAEKMERALKMADVNAKQSAIGEPVYMVGEIRDVTGHDVIDTGGDDE